jgi:two-component sensor histidine kinase
MKGWKIGELAKGRFDRWLRDYPRATPIGIFLFVLTLIGASAWSVELAGERSTRATTTAQANDIAAAIERQAAANGAYLQATSALFMSLRDVSPEFFQQFVERLQLAHDLSGVVGLGWSEPVSPKDIPALAQKMRARGHENFAIHPAPDGKSDELQIVNMLEPRTPANLASIGFDMQSEPRRAAAMNRARRTNAIAATDPVKLLQDTQDGAAGFLVYVPVSTWGQERQFKGYVYTTIRTLDFIQTATRTRLPAHGRIEILDATPQGNEQIFTYSSGEDAFGSPVEQRLAVFDQQWILRYYPAADRGLFPLTLVVLIGGVSFSLLLLAYILLVQRRNEDLQSLVSAQAEREAERAAFVRELNHRVKNSLSNVTSIISLTRRNAKDIDSFTSSLLERVRALAASHSLLDGAQWGPTDLKALVEAQLSSYNRADGRIRIDGPSVLISPNDALSIGLALHELLTNAARYGALSTDEGKVSIRWDLAGETVSVLWEESGGPAVTAPEKRGFGLNLIERALAQELGSPIAITFLPTGLRCQFTISLRKPQSFRLSRSQRPENAPPAT